jgi:hypothetical protein
MLDLGRHCLQGCTNPCQKSKTVPRLSPHPILPAESPCLTKLTHNFCLYVEPYFERERRRRFGKETDEITAHKIADIFDGVPSERCSVIV